MALMNRHTHIYYFCIYCLDQYSVNHLYIQHTVHWHNIYVTLIYMNLELCHHPFHIFVSLCYKRRCYSSTGETQSWHHISDLFQIHIRKLRQYRCPCRLYIPDFHRALKITYHRDNAVYLAV